MKENERKRERWCGTKKDKTKNGRCWGHPVAHTNLWIEVILENLGTIRAGSSRRSSGSTVIHWWRTVNNLARLSSLSIRPLALWITWPCSSSFVPWKGSPRWLSGASWPFRFTQPNPISVHRLSCKIFALARTSIVSFDFASQCSCRESTDLPLWY